jgi:DNA-binding NarL/FixJ family response regulator
LEVTERGLTVKQKGVCDLLVLGFSNKEISTRLAISNRTVEAHRAEVFRRMGVRNATELVRLIFSLQGSVVSQ